MHISKTKIAIAMLKAGINSQLALADKAGVHPNTISNTVRGATVSIETIGKLAEALNVEPSTLIEEAN